MLWVGEFDRKIRLLCGAFEPYFLPWGWEFEQPKFQKFKFLGGDVKVLIWSVHDFCILKQTKVNKTRIQRNVCFIGNKKCSLR